MAVWASGGAVGINCVPAVAGSGAGVAGSRGWVIVERYDLGLFGAAPNTKDKGVVAKTAHRLDDAWEGGFGVVIVIAEGAAAEVVERGGWVGGRPMWVCRCCWTWV